MEALRDDVFGRQKNVNEETCLKKAAAEAKNTEEEAAAEMEAEDLSQTTYIPAADALKFWLMPFVCILCFGFPTRFGGNVSALCGFAPLCFYILCGFFALTGAEDGQMNLKKGIRRSILLFVILFAICLAVNVLYYFLTGLPVGTLFSALLRKRILFNFFVLCVWPFQMGESICFIQSLFYAYVILFILNALHLQKLRKLLFVLCVLLMILTGELAGLIRFRFLGYPCLPPDALTRALPYMLLGGIMREKEEQLWQKRGWIYLLMIPLGLVLAYGEFFLLSLTGLLITTSHAIGLGMTAFGLCAWVLLYTDPEMEPNYFCLTGRPFAKRIYLLSQPVAFLLIVPMSLFFPPGALIIQMLGGVIVYAVCQGLVLIFDMARFYDRE